ncbi:MAG: diguanylate cyclase [Eubacterium sp.]|nr:diguanylate cyclase [Eubacterium sp.]
MSDEIVKLKDIYNSAISFRKRIAYVITLGAAVANVVGIITNFLLFGFNSLTVFLLICTVFSLFVFFFGMRRRRYRIYTHVMVALIIIVEFPLLTAAYGPIMFPYMMIGFAGLVMYLKKRRLLIMVLVGAYNMAVVTVTTIYPYIFGKPASGPMIIFAIATYFISSTTIAVMFHMWATMNASYIDETQNLNEQLKETSEVDTLTKAYNRRYFTNMLQNFEVLDNKHCVFLIDIDDFKKINDTYGHPFGDETLIALCETVRRNSRRSDILVRYGGEEFLIIFMGMDETVARARIRKILSEFSAFGEKRTGESFTFSGGAAFLSGLSEEIWEKVYEDLDKKLYYAKTHGKKQICWELSEEEE